MRWLLRSAAASALSVAERGVYEEPAVSRVSLTQRQVISFGAWRCKRFQGAFCWAWSSEDLARFISALGLPRVALIFLRNHLDGSDIKSLSTQRLHALGIRDQHIVQFLHAIFRVLSAVVDESDILYPRRLRRAPSPHQQSPRPHQQPSPPVTHNPSPPATHNPSPPATHNPSPPATHNPSPPATLNKHSLRHHRTRESHFSSAEPAAKSSPPSAEPPAESSPPSAEPAAESSPRSFLPRLLPSFSSYSFVLRKRIGAGGHAVVYQAIADSRIKTLPKAVALKCFPCSRKMRACENSSKIQKSTDLPPAKALADIGNKVVETLGSMKRWLKSPTAKEQLPTIVLSRAESNNEEAPVSSEADAWVADHASENLVWFSKSGGERARDKELLILRSIPLHSKIIECHGVLNGGLTGIVLELCEKGAVHDIIMPVSGCPSQQCSRKQMIGLFADVAEGLAALHEAGFVHRDIKPSNFLIDSKGQAKLSDFGMAAYYRDMEAVFLASYGNIFYAAPEVLRGDGFWPESDIFSFGVSFWEALMKTGSYPGLTKGQIFTMVATNNYLDLFAVKDDLGVDLTGLLYSTLEFDPLLRPNARHVATSLRKILETSSAVALSRVQSFFDL